MKRKVLIVDRRKAFAAELGLILKDEGYDVKIVDSSYYVNALHKTYEYDAIFMDFESYALCDPSLMEEVKQVRPEVRLILINEDSTMHDTVLLKNAVICEVYGSIRRPFDRKEIQGILDGLTNGNGEHDPD